MKYIILFISLSVITISHAQKDSTAVSKKYRFKVLMDSLVNTELEYLKTLESLLDKKNNNTTQFLEVTKANTARFNTQLLLMELKLSETQIALYNVQASLKKEKKKNFWKGIGFGAGGLVVGVVAGVLLNSG